MALPNNTIPVLAGAAIGAVAISIIALSSGWVIASSKAEAAQQEMTIDLQASICAARASEHLKSTGSTADLEGYQAAAREKREELARSYTTPLMGEDTANGSVINACARMLNRPNT
ncbi:MAG: hypothetical protein RH946_07030 [Rhodospirillales bacterium]